MENAKYASDNDLTTCTSGDGCSRAAAGQCSGCGRDRRFSFLVSRFSTLALLALLALLAVACDGGEPAGPGTGPEPLPDVMDLNGTAAQTFPDGSSISCTLFLHIVLTDEGELGDGVRTYRATSGGDATRSVLDAEGNGFQFWPHLHSGATVRVRGDSIEVEADGLDETTERFYRGIMLLAGARSGPGEAAGEWQCAPLDIDSGGWLDTTGVASGTWTLEAAEL